ncbi:MAG: ATP-binding cassette domain-containing protein [Gammaproteobacteria bacterium]|nr:ATP-binding cassette domain-containing protein [Gammaproteobacteria bacterium]
MTPVLEVNNLSKTFGGGKSLLGKPVPSVHAVQSASFTVQKGETLGIVGESGCGKSTLARMLVGLLPPTGGNIIIEGQAITGQPRDAVAFGRLIQYVFQDPISSLNPRKTIRQIIEAPLIHLMGMDQAARRARINELFDSVNLRREFLDRYPHEFSGGQAQRIGIARALAASPRIIVLDEPVSALDVSVQAQVLNLLADLRKAYDLTYLLISHDLAVVEAVSDRIAVLYFGSIVEIGSAESVLTSPRHPYTNLLGSSVPMVGRALVQNRDTSAELPDPHNPPSGCAFANRCYLVQEDCRKTKPRLRSDTFEHETACFHPIETRPT